MPKAKGSEVPITSYFSVLPPKAKNKRTDHSRGPPTKRQRIHAEADDADVAVIQKSNTRPSGSQEGSSALARTRRTSHNESHYSIPASISNLKPSRAPAAPERSLPALSRPSNINVLGSSSHTTNRKPHPLPSTPPPPVSREPSNLNLMYTTRTLSFLAAHAPDLGGTVSVKDPPDTMRDKTGALAGFPAVLGSCVSNAESPVKMTANKERTVTWDDALDYDDGVALSPLLIPSSQSQDLYSTYSRTSPSSSLRTSALSASRSDHFVPSFLIPGQPSPRPRSGSSGSDIVPSSQSQYFDPCPTPTERDDGFIVPSSQSQWLGPLDPDCKVQENEDDGDNFIVPSSQSQWLCPLDFSREEEKEDIDDSVVPSSQAEFELELTARDVRKAGIIPGCMIYPVSLVGEVSDSEIDATNMFQDRIEPADIITSARDDSATESESDDDEADIHVETGYSKPLEGSILDSGDDPYGGAASLSKPDDSLGSSGASVESAGSSFPDVVKDFFDMIGEGSYPDDFPQSLKWNGDATQDYSY